MLVGFCRAVGAWAWVYLGTCLMGGGGGDSTMGQSPWEGVVCAHFVLSVFENGRARWDQDTVVTTKETEEGILRRERCDG